MTSDLGPWEPMAPSEVTDLLRTIDRPWWIAGGWALDLHLGRQTRPHDDTDVLVLRADQLAMQEALVGWDLHAADPPGSLRPWRPGEILPAAVHDVWCRRTPASPWSLQVMIDDAEGGTWTYRRDARIRRPVAELDGGACQGDPRVLSPEIQLLQKSKTPRPKDEADLRVMKHVLDPDQRAWLVRSLTLTSPGHPWLGQL
ncbi:hypothetical protein NPS01_29360 [Nocardioides psychrotolerans]|uniref:Aminoglycoside-2''-adenylyltransferase n=1 Tax=Nocardioides psychrotolerans TaxID=1005945 RepID=A0A1I3DWX5_9ACTN|nr:hypothetical protein [Nocardioides psychrotolerans]GEP39273.1 hypothetical protein NPS01_29360 [Nocardioides psychrotolerans]SFH91133.1 Aminoglycoside-2''-adenylyltransferase [Nocardioides psychrotolerans]